MGKFPTAAPLLLAAMTLAAPAHAGDQDRARHAVQAAESKIEGADAFSRGRAVPIMAAARRALAKAQLNLRRGNEDRALFAAREAEALAEQAIATHTLDALSAERQSTGQAAKGAIR